MANEHAESSALGTNDLQGLASFLSDTPDEATELEDEEALTDDSTAEGDTDEEDTDGQEESDDDESDDEDAEDTPAPDRKLKVAV